MHIYTYIFLRRGSVVKAHLYTNRHLSMANSRLSIVVISSVRMTSVRAV